MHICFLTHEYPLPGHTHGGIGSFIKTQAEELIKKGCRVSIVGCVANNAAVFEEKGIKIYVAEKTKWKFGRFVANSRKINALLKEIHKKDPINIIESSELGLAFIKRLKGIRYIIRLHGGHHFFSTAENKKLQWWKVLQEKRSFKKADEFVAVSNYVAQSTKKLLDIRQNIKVIYNPINSNKFPKADNAKIRKHLILFIGTVCEKKGVRQLIQAMPLVKKQFPDVQLKIVGRDKRSEKTGTSYVEFLKTYIDDSVANAIHFSGEVSNDLIPSILEEAEICVFPSHMESLGIAWLEALAMGKSFIGSNAGPGSEIVANAKTGLLVNPFDPADIAEKIIFMLQHKEEAQKMGEAGRADVLSRFDLEKSILENIEFYKEITNC